MTTSAAPTTQQLRLSEYIKKCRGVSPGNPDGNISQRAFSKMIGINVSSINAYENRMDVNINKIDGINIEKLAAYPAPWKGRSWSVGEFMAYLNNETLSNVDIDKVLGTIRNEDDLEKLISVQQTALLRMGELIKSTRHVNGSTPEFPKFNTQLLKLLSDRREHLGMANDEYADEWNNYCKRRGLNRDILNGIENGNTVDVPALGFIARVLDLEVDTLLEMQARFQD